MPLLAYPQLHKPIVGRTVDPTHPLALGLVACFLFNENGGVPTEIIGRTRPTASAAFSWSTSPGLGLCGVFNGTSTNLTYTLPTFGPAMSIVCGMSMTALTGNQSIIERSPINGCWDLRLNGSSFAWVGAGVNVRNTMATTGLAVNVPFGIAVTDTGAGTSSINGSMMYRNGVAASLNGAGSNVAPGTSGAIHLGNYDASSYWLGGNIGYIYIYNYALSGAQILSLYQNPWQIFPPAPSFRPALWLPSTSSGGGGIEVVYDTYRRSVAAAGYRRRRRNAG